MKNTTASTVDPFASRDLDAAQARFARRLTARLTEQAEQAPHDVTERLRFAREQALERAREARRKIKAEHAAPAVHIVAPGLASLSGGRRGAPWWFRLVAVAPVVVLIAGLSLIQRFHDDAQISDAAEIDTALLSDDLPPEAYRDAGFVEFLKTSQE
jgi:hypothetical protein